MYSDMAISIVAVVYPREQSESLATIVSKKSQQFETVKNWEWLNLCCVLMLEYHADITSHVFEKNIKLKREPNGILTMVLILYKLFMSIEKD